MKNLFRFGSTDRIIILLRSYTDNESFIEKGLSFIIKHAEITSYV